MGPCSTHVVQPVLSSRSVLMQVVQSSGLRGRTQASEGGVVAIGSEPTLTTSDSETAVNSTRIDPAVAS